jgi:putative Holliday junction resolvase
MSPRLAQNKVSRPDYREPEGVDNRASVPHPIIPVTDATLIAIEDLPPRLAAEARLLGLDVGTKTVGMALSDITRSIATPFDTIRRTKFTADAKAIREVIEKNQVGALVIGLPLNLDGSEGPRAQSTRAFARNLAAHVAVPMVFWDERLSTAAVERHLIEADASRKRRAEVVDRMAAAYILQGALDRLRRLTEQRHA